MCGVNAFCHYRPFPEACFSAYKPEKEYSNRHKAESADLYQRDNDNLTEQRPIGSGILQDKTRNTGSRGRSKNGSHGTCANTRPRSAGEHK